MPSEFIRFLKSLAVFSLVAAALYAALIYYTTGTSMYLPKSWGLFAFVILMTAAFHYGLLTIGNQDNRSFVRYYMSASTFKILIYVVIIIIVAFTQKALIKPFAVYFFVLYILFTAFEVMYLQKMYLKKP